MKNQSVKKQVRKQYSAEFRKQVRISPQAGRKFHGMPVSDFTSCRSVISHDAGRSERVS